MCRLLLLPRGERRGKACTALREEGEARRPPPPSPVRAAAAAEATVVVAAAVVATVVVAMTVADVRTIAKSSKLSPSP